MSLPAWVDFESAERSAAVMARNLSGSPQAWKSLLAHAQGVLASRTDGLHYEPNSTYGFNEWRDLVAAARILDLASTDYGVSDSDNRRSTAILAACAFGMSGTFVSAAAVIKNHHLLDSNLSPGELTALALCSPILSREILPRLPAGLKHKDCIENITAFLATGDESQFETATKLLQEIAFDEAAAWEGYLLRNSRLSLAHVRQLATVKVLEAHKSRFPPGYFGQLVDESPLLLPPQFEAINEQGVIDPTKNLLITLPPGTGKTLLGELALLSSLGQTPGLVCYIAPYVALARQASEKIQLHSPEHVRIHQSIGDYPSPASLDPENHLEVLVATPERFDGMLRFRPDLLSRVRCVVFDEAHILENGQRGLKLEGILTRLKLASVREEISPRFVLLSAVLSNSNALAEWIGVKPANFVRGSWRPSAQRLLRWTEDGVLRLHAGDDPLRNSPSETLGETRLPWPNKQFFPAKNYGGIRMQEPYALENVAFLADYVYKQYGHPVLCICSTRDRTRQLAAHMAKRFAPIEPLPDQLRRITDLIDKEHQFLLPLKESLQRGVAYHNASLPHEIRKGIEDAIESRILRVVAATTTLAEGVDLPIRATILADWLMYDGEKNSPMGRLLFRNISGRCGRPGQFTEGDTFVFDNPVGDAQFTTPARRPTLQDSIFFAKTQPTLRSAIDQLDRKTSVAIMGSQLLAAIAENPGVENLNSLFCSNSFAYQTPSAESVEESVELAFSEILDDADEQPLAVAQSPVRLTSFGKVVNKSGLSPSTAKALRRVLGKTTEQGSTLGDLVVVGKTFLESLADTPEQRDRDLRKAVLNRRSRPVVKLDELESVFSLWLRGEALESIFAEIPTNKKSRRKPDLQTWLQGTAEENTWDDKFARFCEFMNNCMNYFLPWILRSSQPLAELDGKPEKPWYRWAKFVDLGVGSTWGTFLLEEEIISKRTTAFQIGEKLDELTPVNEPTRNKLNQDLLKYLQDDVNSQPF